MKVTILQEELARGLAAVSRVVATRGQLPVLSHVLLEASTNGLTLSATNLELGMRVFVGGKTDTSGAVTVPAKNLAEFVSALQADQVTLTVDGEKLKIGNGRLGGTFTGISASEFPAFAKTIGDGGGVEIKREIIAEIYKQVAFAAATDESRPVLTGVQFTSGERLVVTATDGFRMSRKMLSHLSADMRSMIILPARAIGEVNKIASEGRKESVLMTVIPESNQVVFVYDKTELVSRVLEGNFPDVNKIIPVEFKTRTVIDTHELLRAVKAVAIFARENNNIIKFRIGGSKFKVYAAASQAGESDAEVEAEISGEDLEIAFNYRYVIDFLGSVVGERVIFESNGSLAPGVWKSEQDESITHLVMPVRI